jgi:hypothetical protein
MPRLLGPILAIAIMAVPGACLASPPTLCVDPEKTYLTGRLSLQYVASGATQADASEVSRVSLCLDGAERSPSLVFRLDRTGASGTVVRSGPKRRFYTFTSEDGPHHGRDIIVVRDGSTVYCLSAATAQGRGVGLEIRVDGQWPPVWLFSGIETGVTYEIADDDALKRQVRALLRQGGRSSCT